MVIVLLVSPEKIYRSDKTTACSDPSCAMRKAEFLNGPQTDSQIFNGAHLSIAENTALALASCSVIPFGRCFEAGFLLVTGLLSSGVGAFVGFLRTLSSLPLLPLCIRSALQMVRIPR